MQQENPTFGCLIFDDPNTTEYGWCAQGKGEATRFTSLDALTKQYPSCFWISNIPFAQKNKRFSKGTLWTSDFLHEDIHSFALHDAKEQAEFWAKILDSVMQLFRTFCCETLPKHTLKFGFSKFLGFSAQLFEQKQAEAFIQATRTTCECWTNYPPTDALGIFRLPQYEHCNTLLNAWLPFGRWVESTLFPKEYGQSLYDYIAEKKDHPGLFRITIQDIDPNTALCILGKERERTSLWVTSPDLALLSHYAQIRIEETWFSSSKTRIRFLDTINQYVHERESISLAWHLFFENLWLGLTVSPKKVSKIHINKIQAYPIAAFIRAYDRLHCFEKALSLSSCGIPLIGFGNGRIRVDLRNKDPYELYQIACANNLLPPKLAVSPKHLPKPSLAQPLSYLQFFLATGNMAAIAAIDE